MKNFTIQELTEFINNINTCNGEIDVEVSDGGGITGAVVGGTMKVKIVPPPPAVDKEV